eukprot:CAMPEP_0194048474 /NCGR_PEP_ID=MMETSP0009_2-20130614/27396_1 /TAXON_ID=210454 /ORGANISM="Grammatophora oceanica, Strain CCMP 410" /LENGTH=233 /DNA_ID=CAMNT_0038694339 /DNA_START=191 /DNA_END=892 /DNA_ORIENTATION=-
MAWMASVSQDGCDYSRVAGPAIQDLTNTITLPWIEVGFIAYRVPTYSAEDEVWFIDYNVGCVALEDSMVDGYWKAAKGFAFMALVLGGSGALFTWFSSCFIFSPATWRWAAYQILTASICQCLAFMWFATSFCKSNSCDMFYGSKADILSAVLWLASAVMMIARYPSPRKYNDDGSEIETAEEEVVPELPVDGDATARISTTTDDSTASTNGDSSTSSQKDAVQMKEANADLV